MGTLWSVGFIYFEKLNIKLVVSTGAESPWQNGLIERGHMIVDTIIEKMKKDQPNVPVKQLIPHAIFAKNAMINHLGLHPK